MMININRWCLLISKINYKKTLNNFSTSGLGNFEYQCTVCDGIHSKTSINDLILEKNKDYKFSIDEIFINETINQIKNQGVYFNLIEVPVIDLEYDEEKDEVTYCKVEINNEEIVMNEQDSKTIQESAIYGECSYFGIRIYTENDEIKFSYGYTTLPFMGSASDFEEISTETVLGKKIKTLIDNMIVFK